MDQEVFINNISKVKLADNFNDINDFANELTEMLYESNQDQVVVDNVNTTTGRWDRLLHDGDDARVWQAVDWNGKVQDNSTTNATSTDDKFKTFYESMLSPDLPEDVDENFDFQPDIPILHDSITTD